MTFINIHLTPGSKVEKCEIGKDLFGNEVYNIKIKAKPIDGEANKSLIDFLSQYFNIPKRNVKIVSGQTSRNKLVKIGE